MQIGSVIHGFRVTNVREFPEMEAKLWEMEHEKTGAQLVWVDRADSNKAFYIAFKTIPEDSTGVFHILEHSVLCGSDKYPVKEPFVELLKTSVQTFLNAMTYPDKTVYPVASRNNQDFLNLIDIYLDAVLHPAIYHKPEIFRQEGWRYEKQENETVYQGVVLNEMKGVYSSARDVLEFAMFDSLFPDNSYRHDYGGNPEHIPDLSYEQFLAMHGKYYHPSNARIALDGSVDLDPVLEKIDSFLAPYDRQEMSLDIPLQGPAGTRTKEYYYEIGQDEPMEDHTVISCGAIIGDYHEREKLFAASILSDYLAGDNDAPLKKAVISAGLGQEMNVSILDGMLQNVISWVVWNTDTGKLDSVRSLIRETLEKIAADGLDLQRLRACYNAFAFRQRDRDGGYGSRSLNEALSMLDTWLFGGDPAEGVLVEDALTSLQAKLETGYFADLLRELFLDNPNLATAVLLPSRTLGAEMAQRAADRIARESAKWDEARIAELAEQAESLAAWQQAPDSPEALATIPMLKLSDLAPAPEALDTSVSERNGISVLRHKTGSKLTSFKAFFNLSDFPLEDLPALSFLTSLLGVLGTSQRSGEELQMQIKEHIGRLRITCSPIAAENPDSCTLQLAASVTCLPEQAEESLALVKEILTDTQFTDSQLVKERLSQAFLAAQMSLSSAGSSYAATRILSYFSSAGIAADSLSGTEYALWLKRWNAEDESSQAALLDQFAALCRKAVDRSRLTISCNQNLSDDLVSELISAIPDTGDAKPDTAHYAPRGVRREGIVIPATIGFAGRGGNFKLSGQPYSGSYPVLTNILNFVYLWSEIRVQGGAYGCGFQARDDGSVVYYSYRDPQPARSLDVIDRACDFVRSFCAENPDLTGYILGSVSSMDPLLNDDSRMALAESRYFKGLSYEEVCRRYSQLIHTSKDDLLALLPALEAVRDADATCVVAGAALLDACAERLESRISV